MRRCSPFRFARTLAVAALLSILCGGALPKLHACPFCTPSLSYAEQLKTAQSAVFVTWTGAEESGRKTSYVISEILFDRTVTLAIGQVLRNDPCPEARPGQMFLFIGNLAEGQLSWAYPLEMTTAARNYIVDSPPLTLPSVERLAYFLRFLEDPDGLIAIDAYSEFATAQYDDVVPLADQIPRDKLRAWLSDPEITPTRVGLYGMMLGLCGSSDDAEFLEGIIQTESEETRLGIDGVMAGYLLLTGADGLELIDQTKLANPRSSLEETYSAKQALDFLWSYGGEKIPRERLRASMRLLLDRQQLAELVIVDLARWQDWSVMDRLMALYGHGDYDLPSVKKTIIRYLMTAADSDEPDAATPSAHVLQAREHLDRLSRTDPEMVAAAERHAFD